MTIIDAVLAFLAFVGAGVSWYFSHRANKSAEEANKIAMRTEYLDLRRRYKEISPNLAARGSSSPQPNEVIASLDQLAGDAKVVNEKACDALKNLADVVSNLSGILKVEATEASLTNRELAKKLEYTGELGSAMAKVERVFEELLS